MPRISRKPRITIYEKNINNGKNTTNVKNSKKAINAKDTKISDYANGIVGHKTCLCPSIFSSPWGDRNKKLSRYRQ